MEKIKAQATQMPPPPQTEVTKTHRVPSRTLFILGAIGTLLSGTAFFWSFYGFSLLFLLFLDIPLMEETSLIILAGILGGIGLILAGMGYLGFKRNYGVNMGIAGFIFGIVSGLYMFAYMALVIILDFPGSHDWGYSIYVLSSVIYLLLFGVMQIFWGLAHIKSRQYTEDSELAKATGLMFIISGALMISLMFSLVGFILFFVCDILAMHVFLTSKIPEQT